MAAGRKKNSGEPVCVRRISEKKSFRGKRGLAGAAGYLAKDLDRNAKSKILRRRLGKRLDGASKLVRALGQDWSISAQAPTPTRLTDGGPYDYFVERMDMSRIKPVAGAP